MIASMTGYGRGEASADGVSASVELRGVNSRFLEVSTRLPRSLSHRENDMKEIIRKKIARGKIYFQSTIEKNGDGALPLRVNVAAAKSYYKLLNDLRKSVKLRQTVRLEHLLQFSEVLDGGDAGASDEKEWIVLQKAISIALDDFILMRRNEGGELYKDFHGRIKGITEMLDQIEQLSIQQIPEERTRLRERIQKLLEKENIDEGRLEMELALLADRLDVTEECVRFRSHNKFFLEALDGDEAVGRKLNFLVQEMNREANTIGSKSSTSEIAHRVVNIKEELEKIREQLQNIE